MSDPVEVLEFWLHEIGQKGWYAGGEEIDLACTRFADLWQAAREGGLEHWVDGTVGTLAYLILTDQIPRNIPRGTALAFATDAQARAAEQATGDPELHYAAALRDAQLTLKAQHPHPYYWAPFIYVGRA